MCRTGQSQLRSEAASRAGRLHLCRTSGVGGADVSLLVRAFAVELVLRRAITGEPGGNLTKRLAVSHRNREATGVTLRCVLRNAELFAAGNVRLGVCIAPAVAAVVATANHH